MDSDKPDFTGLIPPKQILRFQEVANRITGSTATAQVQAQVAAIERFKAKNLTFFDTLQAQIGATQRLYETYFGNSQVQRLQADLLKGFQIPSNLVDMALIAQNQSHWPQLKELHGALDQIDIAPRATSSIESLRATLSSVHSAEINRIISEIGLLAGKFEEQGKVAAGYDEVHESLDRLREAPTLSEFSSIFASLPGTIRLALIFIFIGFWDVFSGVGGNLITPHVKELIEDPALTQREKVAKVRSDPLRLDPLLKSHVRFINAERVNLRLEPSIKSTIVTVMSTGRVVTVLSKRRNWIEVAFADKNGDEFEGWVFTRYTSRFR